MAKSPPDETLRARGEKFLLKKKLHTARREVEWSIEFSKQLPFFFAATNIVGCKNLAEEHNRQRVRLLELALQ